MSKTIYLAAFMAGILLFAGCSDEEVSTSQVNYQLTPPQQLDGYTISSGEFTFTNVSTGIETKIAYSPSMAITVPDGLYNVYFLGDALYTPEVPAEDASRATTQEVTQKVQGSKQNVQVTGGVCDLTLDLYVVNNESTDFIIAEIFGTMSYYPDMSKQYRGDQYVRIYNNTSKTLYADGLVFMESEFTSVASGKHEGLTPNMNDKALTIQAIAMIPGSGTDHPVAPGESIILCDNAIDHTQTNPNSIDLSHADFEWFTSGTTSNPDVDNPDVPNLEMLYNYTRTIWILSSQGNRSYAIGRIPAEVGTEKYLSDYTYDYTYTMITGATSKVQHDYYFPYEWITDGVNLSPKNAYAWNILAPVVDMGYTYYGENATSTETTGKAVVRKVASTTEDGRVIYQDTNNSSVDFIPAATPTLKK